MPSNFKWPIPGLDLDRISSLSRSQAGQDLFVIALTQGKKNGRWLELGCGYPKQVSNTWLLEKEFGWTGTSIDSADPLTQAHHLWMLFYSTVRSCFGHDIPDAWIENPKDIFALPDHVQKQLIDIHDYDRYVDNCDWHSERPGAEFIITDALNMDFATLSGPYDYLQIDIDDHANHCNLLQSVIKEHEFQVITFEHDFWTKTEDTAFCRDQSRKIMQSEGYVLLCTDITCEPSKGDSIDNEPIYFEDWYVHPSRIDKKIIDTYSDVSEFPRPLYYSDVLFPLNNRLWF